MEEVVDILDEVESRVIVEAVVDLIEDGEPQASTSGTRKTRIDPGTPEKIKKRRGDSALKEKHRKQCYKI